MKHDIFISGVFLIFPKNPAPLICWPPKNESKKPSLAWGVAFAKDVFSFGEVAYLSLDEFDLFIL